MADNFRVTVTDDEGATTVYLFDDLEAAKQEVPVNGHIVVEQNNGAQWVVVGEHVDRPAVDVAPESPVIAEPVPKYPHLVEPLVEPAPEPEPAVVEPIAEPVTPEAV